MRIARVMLQRIRSLGRRSRAERLLADEIELHMECLAREFQASGMSEVEARRAALREFGPVESLKEKCRDARRVNWIEDAARDVAYALRVLRRSPGFTLTALLSLALGIGANTAIFSVIDSVLLKSLPVRNPEQLRILTWIADQRVRVPNHSGYRIPDANKRMVDGSFSWPAYEAFRSSVPAFSDVMAFTPAQVTVMAGSTSDYANAHFVSGNYFAGLGAAPLLGRAIAQDDAAPGRPPVAVLTWIYWQKRFGLDPSIVGRVISVNQLRVTIAGVMRREFQGLYPGPEADIFLPMTTLWQTGDRWRTRTPDDWWVQIVGRLRPGYSDRTAEEQTRAALAHVIEAYEREAKNRFAPQIELLPGAQGIGLIRSRAKTLYVLAGVCGLVLLIACLNIANLLIGRSVARRREMAIRLSIGASRRRLLRQLLAESILVSVGGAALGLVIANPLSRLMLFAFSGNQTYSFDVGVDARVMAFTTTVSVIAALFFGTVPSWLASGVDLNAALKTSGGPGSGPSPRLTFSSAMAGIQIALSLVLLTGAGLLVKSLIVLGNVDLGFRPERILTFETDPAAAGYKNDRLAQVKQLLERRLSAIPGVESVGMSHQGLMQGLISNGPMKLPGSQADRYRRIQTYLLYVSHGFLSTMRIPVLLGRDFTQSDDVSGAHVAIVNEAFAKAAFPGGNPIGKQIEPGLEMLSAGAPYSIIGVAANAHYEQLRGPAPPTAYIAYEGRPDVISGMNFVLRARVEPQSLEKAVRSAVSAVDPALPVAHLQTEEEQIGKLTRTERTFADLVAFFAAIAAMLAAIGLYGVIAWTVARRKAEFGIRMALGATGKQVQLLVLRRSMSIAVPGIAAGIAAALGLTRFIRSFLYEVQPADPVVLATTAAALLAIAMIAAWTPAQAAARVEPLDALRHE